MTTVDTSLLQSLGLTSANAGSSGTSASAPTPKSQLGQQDFLKLLTTQLNNQDPLQPMQNGEFMTQMAQFSTVQGIQELQQSFSSFASTMSADRSLQAASLVGHSALVPAQTASLDSNGLSGAVDLPNAAQDVAVGIYDGSGQLVHQIDLGSRAAGLVDYQWDGTLADGSAAAPGTYYVKAQALIGGSSQEVQNLSSARINSVTFGQSGQDLQVGLAGIGDTALSKLREIR